jgi:hypothetical protein
MKYPINYNNINTHTDYYEEVKSLYIEAESYLNSFKWCKEIKSAKVYTNLGKVFCIFLFEIENAGSDDDNFLWVIVGDIPAMYLDVFGPKTTKDVVNIYIELAEDWINSIKAGKGANGCYPFDAEPTLELAELLEKKISFMKTTVVNNIQNIKLTR